MFPIPLFPEGGLASSVITTVWVGVFVLCFFNLRFGWVLSGLVVPGYLVPLLVIKPVAAMVIAIEAVLTYLIVHTFSERLAPGRYPALFGRDRFMGLILASIAVRLAMDGLILPEVADWLAARYDQQIDWRSDLQSFGLVIISLLANQFWKPGLVRGLASAIVVTGITYLIVRYGLMELTNFRLSGVTYLYEGLASSILASPKAYMILVLTALYASHMNVRYGWDFSGILIPALIALQWYQPTKILTSFVEAAGIYVAARQLLKLPWLQNATIEGANKILLFFNISFVLKLLVGHALVLLDWDVKTTDFYGFGYLLSTLLAMKAHDKDIFPRLVRSTLQVSFVGAALGNLAGLGLAALLPAAATAAGKAREAGRGAGGREDGLVAEAIGWDWLRRAGLEPPAQGRAAATGLADAMRLLEAGFPRLQAGTFGTAGGWRHEALGAGRTALVAPAGDALIVHDALASRNVAVMLEAPAAQPGLGIAAHGLARRLGARWFVVAAPPAAGSRAADVPAAFRAGYDGTAILVQAGRRDRLELSGDGAALSATDLRQTAGTIPVTVAPRREVPAARLVLSAGRVQALNAAGGRAPDDAAPPCANVAETAAPRGAKSPARLMYLREEVAGPLLAAAETASASGPATLATVRAVARPLGFAVGACRLGDRRLTVLAGPRGEGVYLFDPGGRRDRLLLTALRAELLGTAGRRMAPAPALRNAGLAMGAAMDARLYALAPRELTFDDDRTGTFGIVLQTALDRLGNDSALVVQLRPPPRSASRLFPGRLVITPERLGEPAATYAELLVTARSAGFDPLLADRSRRFAGYEAYPQTALQYLGHSFNKRYAVLFVPPAGNPPVSNIEGRR